MGSQWLRRRRQWLLEQQLQQTPLLIPPPSERHLPWSIRQWALLQVHYRHAAFAHSL